MIALAQQHVEDYPDHRARDRIKQLGLTEMAYSRLLNHSSKQTVRESAIPDEDLVCGVAFFVSHPDVGAGKARATLLAKEQAWISTANLNEIKHELATAAAQEYKERDEAKKLLEAQLRKSLAARKKTSYEHIKAKHIHDIWAIDFVNIVFMGNPFVLCAVYDEYSQAYPAIRVGTAGDQHLAAGAFQQALIQTSTKPNYLRRDNGKPFETECFQSQIEETADYPIPAGCPWWNGSLESCNGSLKVAIKTTGMQKMAEDRAGFRRARRDATLALEALQNLVDDVRNMLNKDIARLRHGMTPHQVSSGEHEARARQEAFVARKREERQKRMAEIKSNPERKPKTLLGRVQSIIKRTVSNLGTDALYVLNEVLHHRFGMFET